VALLRQELEANPAGTRPVSKRPAIVAAQERSARIRAALEQLPNIAESKKAKEPSESPAPRDGCRRARDEDGDGGFGPAFNVQLRQPLIRKSSRRRRDELRGDQGQMAPMSSNTGSGTRRNQERADRWGFVKKADIDQVSPPQGGTTSMLR